MSDRWTPPRQRDVVGPTVTGGRCLAAGLLLAALAVATPAAAQADLGVTLTESADPVASGAALAYTVAVANAGDQPAADVSLELVLSPGSTYGSASGTDWSCSELDGTVTCTYTGGTPAGTLDGGASAPDVTVDVTAWRGPLQATVTVSPGDANAANDSDSEDTTVSPAIDLALTMSDSPDPVTAGSTLTTTLAVTNSSGAAVTGVQVVDTLPAGATFSTATGADWTCSQSDLVVTCDYTANAGILADAATTGDITIGFVPPGDGPSVSHGFVWGHGTDSSPADNSVTTSTVVDPVADLSVTKSDSPDPVDAAAQLTYTVDVTNNGPSTATTVQVADTLPASVGYLSATGTGWTCSHAAGVVTCTRASLAPGAAPAITITVTAPANGSDVTNAVVVSSATTDPVSANNSDSEATDVTPVADLSLTTADSADPVNAATTFSYTLTVHNAGPSAAASVTVVDTLPAGVTYGSFSPSSDWSCSHAAGTVTCTVKSGSLPLAAGADAPVLTLTVTAPDDGGLVTNSATVSSTTVDRVPGNNTDTEETTITPVSDLAVTKTDGVTSTVPGEPLSYTITLTNQGPSRVTGATLTDTLSDLLGARWSCEVTTGTGVCTTPGGAGDVDAVIDLEKNAVATITVDAWVAPDAAGTVCGELHCLENTATAAVPAGWVEAPADLDDNSATDANTVLDREADLFVTKANEDIQTGDPLDEVGPGQSFMYRLHVGSRGPSSLSGVTVEDVFATDLAGHPVECSSTEYPCWECVPAAPLTFRQTVANEAPVSGLEGARAVAVSPDGAHVYAVGASDGAVVALARTTAHSAPTDLFGSLTFVEAETGITGANAVAVSLDGADVYVTASDTDGTAGSIVKFDRSVGTGELSGRATTSLPGARSVAVSPDGRHVYVAVSTTSTGSVVRYLRAADGAVSTPVAVTHAGAVAIVLSPDGSHVYVASNAGTVTPYTRAADGTLAAGTAVTAAGARALALAPDGAHLYVAGANAVYGFTRDAGTGALSAKTTITDDGSGGSADGLAGAAGVVVSADGRLVAVAGAAENELAVLRRNPATGVLTFVEAIASTTPAPLLDGVTGLAATPDGAHLLAAAATADTVTVLTVTEGAACPSPASGAGQSLAATVDVPANGFLELLVYTRLKPEASGTLSNTATVTAPGGEDPSTGDNSDTDEDAITLATNLAVSVAPTVVAAVPGQAYGYTVVAENAGQLGVVGALLSDDFPDYSGGAAGFTGAVSWSCVASGGGCCTSGAAACGTVAVPVTGSGDLVDRPVDLPPGGRVTFTVTGTLEPASTGTLTNQAAIAPPSGIIDVEPSDDTDQHQVVVSPRADLSVAKTHAPFEAGVDTTVTFTVTAHNAGPSTAFAATVADLLPVYDGGAVLAGFQAGTISWTCTASGGGCCVAGASGAGCELITPQTASAIDQDVDLPPGASVELVISGTVQADPSASVLSNTATITGLGVTDPVTVNDSATDEVVLKQVVDLAISVDDGLAQATPGEEITYTVQVVNEGPRDATGVQVVDVFPADLQGVTWTCSAVSPVPGDLTFDTVIRRLGALEGATAVAVSGNGRHVYVAGGDADAVAVYQRETTLGLYFGDLVFLEAEVDGVNDPTDAGLEVAGLDQPSSLVLSPDGRHLYVTGRTSGDAPAGAVAVFARDTIGGTLSFVEVEADGVDDGGDGGGTVDGISGARAVAVSPDGKHLYVAGGASGKIAVFNRDTTTGRLSFLEGVATGGGVRGVALGPGGVQVYATSGNRVLAYEREDDAGSADFGRLTQLLDTETDGLAGVDGLGGATALAFDPSGTHLYVAGTADSAVVAFRRGADGLLTWLGAATEGVGGVDGIAGVAGVAVAPDGEHVVAAGASDSGGALTVFRRSSASGLLSYQEVHRNGLPASPEVPADGLAGVRGVAFTPDGRHVLTAAPTDDALASFERRAPDPNLLFLEAELDGVDGADGLFGARAVAANPGIGSRWLYIAGSGEDALAVLERDPGKGAAPADRGLHLTPVAVVRNGVGGVTGMSGPADVVASPDGAHVYVAAEAGNAVLAFRQNADGTLTQLQSLVDGSGADGLSGAAGLTFDPSGRYLYVAGQFEASVAVFRRDLASGLLTYIGKQTNGSAGVSGLAGVVDLVVTSDGEHLLAVSRQEDSLVVFRRHTAATGCVVGGSPDCGTLTFVQKIADGAGADGLDGAFAVAVSPENPTDHVYVAGANDGAVAVFRRTTDPSSGSYGRLAFVTHYRDGVGGLDGLAGARGLAMGPNGRYLYVAGELDHALVALERVTDVTNPDYGKLTPFELRRDGVDGVDGLEQIYDIAVSSDGRFIYTAALGDDAVAAFQRRAGSSCTASGSGNIFDTADVAYGGTVTYTATGRIRPGAQGEPCLDDPTQRCLVNPASVAPRTGDQDPDPSNNAATDGDTRLVPRGDLTVSKSDGFDSVVAGEAVTYTITVSNLGPSDVVNDPTWPTPLSATLTDLLSADLTGAAWTCLAVGSGSLEFVTAYTDGDGAVTGLDGASGVAVGVDPDAGGPLTEYVYATGLADGALTMFKRDRTSGTLELLQTIVDGDAVGTGAGRLAGASDVAVSPDGLYVYVTAQVDDALTVLELVPGTGDDATLAPIQTIIGLDQAVGVAVSPDGAHVYVVSANDDRLRAFEVGVDGTLSEIDVEADGIDDGAGAVNGLDGASAVLVSPDGEHVYATGANDGGVAVFARAADGTLDFLEFKGAASSAGLAGARALAIDPTGTHLYVGGGAADAVVALRRTTAAGPGFGTLTPLAPPAVYVDGVDGVSGLRGPRDLVVAPDGRSLYVAGQGSDAIALFSRDTASGRLELVELQVDGLAGTEGLNGVAALALAPDGSALYSAALAGDALAVFGRPADSGCPSSGSGALVDVPIEVAARGSVVFTLHATVRTGAAGEPCPGDASSLCVVNSATVAATADTVPANDTAVDADFLRRRADLAITKSDVYVEHDGLGDPVALALSPGGSSVYVAGAADSAVGVLSRDGATGLLTFRAALRNGVDGVAGIGGAAGVAVSGGGRSVYVTGPADNSVAVFDRDPATGLLEPLEVQTNGAAGAAGLLGARGVLVSPDRAHVYVAGRNSNAVAVFARTLDGDDEGRLVFQQLVANAAGGVTGLVGPTVLAMDATGETLYVAAPGSASILAFARDADSGSAGHGDLSFLQRLQDGVAGVDGLAGAAGLALSPDGEHLYVAGRSDGAVAVLDVNPATGMLTALAPVPSPGAAGVRVSPDGEHVYVTDAVGHAVRVYARDAGSGTLTPHGVVTQGEVQGTAPDEVVVGGLVGAAALALSPDGEYLYVTATGDDAITALDRRTALLPAEDFGRLDYLASWADGGGGAAPGDPGGVTYTIVVANHGPSDVTGARVQDAFPLAFESVAWQCTSEGGASCVALGEGDIDQTVDLPAGSRVIFTAGGVISPDGTGHVVNTATVAEPAGVIDPDPTNNSATDEDTVLSPRADLEVLKAALGDLVPGQDGTYLVTVVNHGPSAVPSAAVRDLMPEAFTDVHWTCYATPPPGLLELLPDQQLLGLDVVAASAVTADGHWLVAAGSSGGVGALALYPRDPRNGKIGAPVDVAVEGSGIDGLSGAADVVVSADGLFAYVAAAMDDAVSVWGIDSAELQYLGVVRDGVGTANGLGAASALALSPSGDHLYVAGTADDAVAVLARAAATGALSFVEYVGSGSMLAPSDLAVTPDGKHVLASAAGSSAVVVFGRAAATGRLTFASAVADGDVQVPDPAEPGVTVTVEGLAGAAAVAVAPDGATVVVAGRDADALAVLARDDLSGALVFREVIREGDVHLADLADPLSEIAIQGLTEVWDVLISPDGGQVYAAGLDGLGGGAVAAFGWRGDRALFLGSFADGAGAVRGRLALAADGAHLYGAGAVPAPLAFARRPGSTCGEAGTGMLADGVALVPAGQVLYRITGRVLSGATGEVTNTASVVVDSRVRDPQAANDSASSTDPLVRQADIGVVKTDTLVETVAGQNLTYTLTVTNHGPGDVASVALHDDLPLFPAAAAGFEPGSLSFTCSATSIFEPIHALEPGTAAADGLAGARWVAVSPDGSNVYATGRTDASVVVYTRSLDGTLSPLQVVSDGDVLAGGTVTGLGGAAGVAVSPDGAHVYVAGATADALVVLARDPVDGTLDLVEVIGDGGIIAGLDGATGVTVSGDGTAVYVASADAAAVAVFSRNLLTGELTFVEREGDGLAGVPLGTLGGAREVVLSGDGLFAYVAAQQVGAVAVFTRDPASGVLAYASAIHDGDLQGPVGDQVQVAGLAFVRSIALSPGGGHLYAASLSDDAVAVLGRDQVSGALTFLEVHQQGVAGISGLDGATAVRVSPDGATVVVAGTNSDALAVFAREWSDGSLAFLERIQAPGATILNGPAGLAFSPLGDHLYAVADTPGSLVAYARRPDGACSSAGATADGVHLLLDLEAGATTTVEVTGRVHPSARGTLVNQASVTVPVGIDDPVSANDVGLDDDTVILVRDDLSITKTDGADTVVAGRLVVYTVVVANAGPSDALGARVQDPLPVQLLSPTWTCVATPGSSCTAAGAGNLDDTVDVLVGGTLTYTIRGTVNPSFVGTMLNVASVLAPADALDPATGDNQAGDEDAVVPVADLAVSKSNGLTAVIPGTPVSYTIVISNLGPSTAVATAHDTPPAQLLPATVAWTCTPSAGASCTAAGSGAIADPIVVPPGGNVQYVLSGTVDPAVLGSLSNTASVQPAVGWTDPAPANNLSTDTDPLTPRADLSLTKDDDVDPVVSAGTLVYTLTVTNHGPSYARGVAVTDLLPPQVTAVATTGCTEDPSGVPTCTLGVVPDLSSVAYTIEVAVAPDAQGAITNSATVSATTVDPVPGNEVASEGTEVLGRVDLVVTMTDSADPVTAGTAFEYAIDVTNNGPQGAREVTLADVVPAGLQATGITGCDSGDWTACVLGTIPPAGSRALVLSVTADADAWGTVTNSAAASTVDAEQSAGDAAADEDTVIRGVAGLTVTKDDGTPWAQLGEVLTYTIILTNDGPGAPASLDLTDLLPTELVNGAWTCAGSGAAVCQTAGVGDVVDTPFVPAGESVSYTVTVQLDPTLDPAPATVANTVTVAVPLAFDPDGSEATATDEDLVVLFADGFDRDGTTPWSGAVGEVVPPAPEADDVQPVPYEGAGSAVEPSGGRELLRADDAALRRFLARLLPASGTVARFRVEGRTE